LITFIAVTFFFFPGKLFTHQHLIYAILKVVYFFCNGFKDVVFFFFACPKKKQKKTPAKDYIPFAGWFPDWTFVLL